MSKAKTQIRTYELPHFANQAKTDLLWQLYEVYKSEYKTQIKSYWKSFKSKKITQFSHLGSTKSIKTNLNASYLQGCLAQACASLNNYIANIETKFKELLPQSSIKDLNLLHQVRTINSQHDWLSKGQDLFYYPELIITIIDDYGNVVKEKKRVIVSDYGTESKAVQKIKINKEAQAIAYYLFKHIIKNRVRFPNTDKPRLILDSRVVKLEPSKSSTYDYWLKISTLTKGNIIQIPLKTYDFFNQAKGTIGNSIELNFKTYPYQKAREIKVYLVKKFEQVKLTKTELQQKTKSIAFDLGLSTFIATSEGELLGQAWLKKLMVYDKKITTLSQARQRLKLKTRSQRFDRLIQSVKGFIKSEVNRILNKYFELHQNIKEVIIEKLSFNNPNLSKRLNRIIKNFGQKLFKDKLSQLSEVYGFSIKEIQPAYSSQECRICGFVDKANRLSQKEFKCLCCGHVEHADVQASKVILERSLKGFNFISKSKALLELKEKFVVKMDSLIKKGYVSRRRLEELFLKKSSYFFASTTKAQGVESVTVLDKAMALFNSKLNCNLIVDLQQ